MSALEIAILEYLTSEGVGPEGASRERIAVHARKDLSPMPTLREIALTLQRLVTDGFIESPKRGCYRVNVVTEEGES